MKIALTIWSLMMLLIALLYFSTSLDAVINESDYKYLWGGDPFPWYYKSQTTYVVHGLLLGSLFLGLGAATLWHAHKRKIRVAGILAVLSLVAFLSQMLTSMSL